MYFATNGSARECGPMQGTQWAVAPNWTIPVRIDTSNRSGSCEFQLGIRDPGLVRIPNFTYRWEPAGPSDAGQCGNRQGTFSIPVNGILTGGEFGTRIQMDTDNRFGFCNLTFDASGDGEYGLDVQFWADGIGQCFNTAPPGFWRTVRPGAPLTIGIDTDSRPGGCQMSLRLSRLV
jgi:hypothetical protein